LFEGKKVNLRVVEKEDLPLLSERDNNPEVARWLVPKMVKNGFNSSFVYWRSI
jgi:hypothetical protein